MMSFQSAAATGLRRGIAILTQDKVKVGCFTVMMQSWVIGKPRISRLDIRRGARDDDHALGDDDNAS
jgi:hypothetical protein